MQFMTTKLAALAAALSLAVAPIAEACTRAVYLGPEDRVLTGRSMDWKLPMVSNLFVFARGMERDGAAGERSATWTSRYGSLALTGYDIATADGLNEAGLNVNLQWEVEATYPQDDGVTPRIPARHGACHRSFCAGQLLHQHCPAKRGCAHSGGGCVQRDPADLGALGYFNCRPTEPFDDTLAHCR